MFFWNSFYELSSQDGPSSALYDCIDAVLADLVTSAEAGIAGVGCWLGTCCRSRTLFTLMIPTTRRPALSSISMALHAVTLRLRAGRNRFPEVSLALQTHASLEDSVQTLSINPSLPCDMWQEPLQLAICSTLGWSGMVAIFGVVSDTSRLDAAGVWGIGVGPTPPGAEF